MWKQVNFYVALQKSNFDGTFLCSLVRQPVWRNKTIWWPPRTFVPAIWSRRNATGLNSIALFVYHRVCFWCDFKWNELHENCGWLELFLIPIANSEYVCAEHFEFHSSQINWSGDLFLWEKGKWKMKWIQFLLKLDFRSWTIYLKRKIQSLSG